MAKIAVVLAGCGHKDGSEITEVVSMILGMSAQGHELKFFAPDQEFEVRDPISNHPTKEFRNVLMEAARITRGQIQPLEKLSFQDFQGVVFPGGSGVARNLCNWAEKASACEVNPEVTRVLQEFHQARKPIAAICIAPVLVAKTLGKFKPKLTLGNDREVASEVQKTGAVHVECAVTGTVVDHEHKIVTTPAYMYGEAKPHEVHIGITKLVQDFSGLLGH